MNDMTSSDLPSFFSSSDSLYFKLSMLITSFNLICIYAGFFNSEGCIGYCILGPKNVSQIGIGDVDAKNFEILSKRILQVEASHPQNFTFFVKQ